MRTMILYISVLFTLWACKGGDENPAPTPAKSAPTAKATVVIPKGVQIIQASAATKSVESIVLEEATKAEAMKRQLIVYVGAEWCEPCKRFHRAAARGQLNAAFPTLTLLEFDRDRDGSALAQAGYSSNLIPLFALPGKTGKNSKEFIQGSVKGNGAVNNIVPRLKHLLEKYPAARQH